MLELALSIENATNGFKYGLHDLYVLPHVCYILDGYDGHYGMPYMEYFGVDDFANRY